MNHKQLEEHIATNKKKEKEKKRRTETASPNDKSILQPFHSTHPTL
jgi:hypothetical protein